MNTTFFKTLLALLFATQSILNAMEQQKESIREIFLSKSLSVIENIKICEDTFDTFLSNVPIPENLLNKGQDALKESKERTTLFQQDASRVLPQMEKLFDDYKRLALFQGEYDFESKENLCAVGKLALINKWYNGRNNDSLPKMDTLHVCLPPEETIHEILLNKARLAVEDMKQCLNFLDIVMNKSRILQTRVEEFQTVHRGLKDRIDFFENNLPEVYPYSYKIVNEVVSLGFLQEQYDCKSEENYCAIGRLIRFCDWWQYRCDIYHNDLEEGKISNDPKEKEPEADKPTKRYFLNS